jgi:enolase
MTMIIDVHGRQVLDSRGNPTVEVEVLLESGAEGRAIVPSGASTAPARRWSCATATRNIFLGKGVTKAVRNVNKVIAPKILGYDAVDQALVDRALIGLDGTHNKGKLGANAILGVSIAVARAAADACGLPLYRYLGGVGGCTPSRPDDEHPERRIPRRQQRRHPGVHGDARRGKCFSDALRMGVETFHNLKKVLKGKGLNTNVGDEGGFAPSLRSNAEAIEVILEAIVKGRLQAGQGHLHRPRRRRLRVRERRGSTSSGSRTGRSGTRRQMVKYYENLCRSTPSFPSRTASRRTTGKAGRSSPRRWGRRSRSSGTTFS